MGAYGYDFYFKDDDNVLHFPITPGELEIEVGSNNKVINLINEGDINILKSPSLIEVSFEARFPMRKYPYSREPETFQTYYDMFQKLKTDKKPFRFIVTRTTPGNKMLWDTNLYVALEEFTFNENADEGDDVLVEFKLKQYKPYGVKKLQTKESAKENTSTAQKPRETPKQTENKTYTVVNGDTLWGIAKKYYGDGTKWTKIYSTNKGVIEADAKKHGRKSSSNGHWIWSGLQLTIPPKE